MIPGASLGRRLAAVLLGAALAVVGLAAPARAVTTDPFTAVVAAGKGTITVDLAAAVYPATPPWVRVSAARNRCTTAAPCWGTPDATVYLADDLHGTATLTGLHGSSQYQVQVWADGAGSITTVVTTPKAPNDAPTDPPLVVRSADGLGVDITVQPETDTEAVNDGGSLSTLKYTVYAFADGALLRKVLSNVPGGVTRTIRGLPRGKALTFAVTDTNSVGESPATTASGGLRLAPAAPAAFRGGWRTTGGAGTISWSAAAPGAGKIARYVVVVTNGSKRVFTKTTTPAVRTVSVPGLARGSSFTATIAAVNSYGVSTTITGTLLTR